MSGSGVSGAGSPLDVLVLGSGVAGLSAAVRLAAPLSAVRAPAGGPMPGSGSAC